MSKVFVTKGDLKVKGVYLVNKDDKPIYHKEFIEAQKKAEYMVKFAELAQGKDFVGKVADDISNLRNEVRIALGNKATTYVTKPTVVKGKLNSELAKEALAWIDSSEKAEKADKINEILQEFNIINKFESVGLYFDEDVCELNKIYTVAEIVEAVTKVADIL
jgi:hypothetical protein